MFTIEKKINGQSYQKIHSGKFLKTKKPNIIQILGVGNDYINIYATDPANIPLGLSLILKQNLHYQIIDSCTYKEKFDLLLILTKNNIIKVMNFANGIGKIISYLDFSFHLPQQYTYPSGNLMKIECFEQFVIATGYTGKIFIMKIIKQLNMAKLNIQFEHEFPGMVMDIDYYNIQLARKNKLVLLLAEYNQIPDKSFEYIQKIQIIDLNDKSQVQTINIKTPESERKNLFYKIVFLNNNQFMLFSMSGNIYTLSLRNKKLIQINQKFLLDNAVAVSSITNEKKEFLLIFTDDKQVLTFNLNEIKKGQLYRYSFNFLSDVKSVQIIKKSQFNLQKNPKTIALVETVNQFFIITFQLMQKQGKGIVLMENKKIISSQELTSVNLQTIQEQLLTKEENVGSINKNNLLRIQARKEHLGLNIIKRAYKSQILKKRPYKFQYFRPKKQWYFAVNKVFVFSDNHKTWGWKLFDFEEQYKQKLLSCDITKEFGIVQKQPTVDLFQGMSGKSFMIQVLPSQILHIKTKDTINKIEVNFKIQLASFCQISTDFILAVCDNSTIVIYLVYQLTYFSEVKGNKQEEKSSQKIRQIHEIKLDNYQFSTISLLNNNNVLNIFVSSYLHAPLIKLYKLNKNKLEFIEEANLKNIQDQIISCNFLNKGKDQFLIISTASGLIKLFEIHQANVNHKQTIKCSTFFLKLKQLRNEALFAFTQDNYFTINLGNQNELEINEIYFKNSNTKQLLSVIPFEISQNNQQLFLLITKTSLEIHGVELNKQANVIQHNQYLRKKLVKFPQNLENDDQLFRIEFSNEIQNYILITKRGNVFIIAKNFAVLQYFPDMFQNPGMEIEEGMLQKLPTSLSLADQQIKVNSIYIFELENKELEMMEEVIVFSINNSSKKQNELIFFQIQNDQWKGNTFKQIYPNIILQQQQQVLSMIYYQDFKIFIIGAGNQIQIYDLELFETNVKKKQMESEKIYQKELRNQIISLEIDGSDLVVGDNKLGMMIFKLEKEKMFRKYKLILTLVKTEVNRRTLAQCCSIKYKNEYLSMDKYGQIIIYQRDNKNQKDSLEPIASINIQDYPNKPILKAFFGNEQQQGVVTIPTLNGCVYEIKRIGLLEKYDTRQYNQVIECFQEFLIKKYSKKLSISSGLIMKRYKGLNQLKNFVLKDLFADYIELTSSQQNGIITSFFDLNEDLENIISKERLKEVINFILQ